MPRLSRVAARPPCRCLNTRTRHHSPKTRAQVAFSRTDPARKVYVQNLIAEQRDKVWQLLKHPRCHYYVCGDSKVGGRVCVCDPTGPCLLLSLCSAPPTSRLAPACSVARTLCRV
jgi:hypothetical protein